MPRMVEGTRSCRALLDADESNSLITEGRRDVSRPTGAKNAPPCREATLSIARDNESLIE